MTERSRRTNKQSASKRSDEIRRRRTESSQGGQLPLKMPRPPAWPKKTSQSPLGRHEDQIQGLTPRARARLTNAGSAARPAASASRRTPAQSSSPAGLPPVMARGSGAQANSSRNRTGATSATSNTPTRRTRRRYDVALGGQGVEMRLPSLPEVRIGWRLLSFGFVAVLGFVLYFVWTSPFYQVNEVQVEGLERLTQRDVSAVLDVSGQPVFTVDDEALSRQLGEAFPEFSAITVTVDLPNTVFVTVTERVPVLIWHQEGRTELVDAEGIAFPPRDSGLPEGLPVVDAQVPPPGLMMIAQPAEENLNDVETLMAEVLRNTTGAEGADLEEAEALESSTAAPTVAAREFLSPDMVAGVLAAAKEVPGGGPLTYTAGHGFQWQDPRGWDVYLGGVTDLQMKLQVYHALIGRLQSEGSQPGVISVEWVHNPYYRLER